MKRFFSSWQGLLAGILAVALYVYSPALIRLYDPTAGRDDGGYLQWIALALATFFTMIFATWAGWQIAFQSMDSWADAHLKAEFKALPGWAKVVMVQISFAFMAWLFVSILKSIPYT